MIPKKVGGRRARSASPINLAVASLKGSPTLGVNERCARLRAEGKTIHHLGFGESPFPVPAQVAEALRKNAHQNRYLPVQGLAELRAAVAEYHSSKDGVPTKPEDVMIGPGSKILMYLLQLAYRGDALIPTPTWVSYLPQAQLVGKRARLIPTSYKTGWKILPEQLEKAIPAGKGVPPMLILNYPGNPTGLSYSESEVKALADVARKRDLLVLSDEIYGGLHYSGGHVSFARHYPEGTVVSSGMSKLFGAGGWRIGTMAFPPQQRTLLNAVKVAAGETFSTTSAPTQHAAVAAFRDADGSIAAGVGRARAILCALGRLCAAELLKAGVRVIPPDGGFYVFPDFSPHAKSLARKGITGGESLCEKLLDGTGVVLLPGSAFLRPKSELTARLAFVDFDGGAALKAAEESPIDRDFVEKYCAPTLEAVRLLTDWLRGG